MMTSQHNHITYLPAFLPPSLALSRLARSPFPAHSLMSLSLYSHLVCKGQVNIEQVNTVIIIIVV